MNLGPIVETDGTYIRRVGPEQRVALESRTACEFTSAFLGRDQVNASVLALRFIGTGFDVKQIRARAQRSGARARNRKAT